jgi:leucyl aminopeptidase
MLAQLTVSPTLPKTLIGCCLKGKTLPSDLPERDLLTAVLKRRNIKADEFADAPIAANHANGNMMVLAMVDLSKSVFAMQTKIRKAMQLLLDEHPGDIAIVIQGGEAQRQQIAEYAVYAAWVNGALLPLHKKKDTRKALQKIALYGTQSLPLSRGKARMGVSSALSNVSTPSLTLPHAGGGGWLLVRRAESASGWKSADTTSSLRVT